MFDYDDDGRTLVMACGAELLVHDGGTEGPLWRTERPTPLIAVASVPSAVVSVGSDGEVLWWDPTTGDLIAEASAGGPATAAAVRPDGAVAVALADRVVLIGPDTEPLGERLVPDVAHIAFGVGGRIAVAAGHDIQVLDSHGRRTQIVPFDDPITALCWCGAGWFAVATGGRIYRAGTADETVPHLTSVPPDTAVTHLAANRVGSRIGIGLDGTMVLVMRWPSRDTVGQVEYLDRRVTGVAFGPDRWLGVGLDTGDGNKIDMQSGATHRTDTQPGREHTMWMLTKSFDDTPPDDEAEKVAALAASGDLATSGEPTPPPAPRHDTETPPTAEDRPIPTPPPAPPPPAAAAAPDEGPPVLVIVGILAVVVAVLVGLGWAAGVF